MSALCFALWLDPSQPTSVLNLKVEVVDTFDFSLISDNQTIDESHLGNRLERHPRAPAQSGRGKVQIVPGKYQKQSAGRIPGSAGAQL